MKSFIMAAASILWGYGQAAGVSNNNQITDSSVGKASYLVVAEAVGGMQAIATWDSPSWSFRGKQASVVFYDGPPPRRHAAQRTDDNKSRYFYLYADHNSQVNHFRPIGYMGDRQDVQVDENNSDDPADGPTCIKFGYAPTQGRGEGWAGIYWIDTRSNWRGSRGGYNLTGMSRLTFWARGEKGGEKIAVFKVGGIGGARAEKGSAAIGPVWLTKEWQHYTIDLEDADLSRVTGGFAWSIDGSDNIGPLVFYLDEIRYER